MYKLSIVTVVLNKKDEFHETIRNIISQTYQNIEIIVIDGGSTDGTLDIIQQYKNKITYWHSEKDKGIYYAMNKGIEVASGDWINFMNAGDLYINNEVLSKVFYDKNYDDSRLLIGDSLIEYDGFKRNYKNGDISSIWKGAQFIHQSCFIQTRYQKHNQYNVNNRISADFEFFYKAIKINKIKTFNLNHLISVFRAGGISDNKRVEALFSNFRLVFNNSKLDFKVIFFYIYKILIESCKIFIKKGLSRNIITNIQKFIYGKN
tara:strand:+ start:2072 stop:2857 length:786 start_codon:yes stop_codon:yes gene_type:complete